MGGGLGSTDEQTAISSPQSASIHSFDQPTYLSTHVLLPDTAGELTNFYHNRPLQRSFTSSDMVPEFLFARFAWAILSDEFYRLLQTDLFKYRVLIFDPKTAKHEEQDLGRKALDKTVYLFPRGSCSRSISPKKRRMPSVEDDEDSADSGESDTSDESESCRGRWRWRPGDSFRAQEYPSSLDSEGVSFQSGASAMSSITVPDCPHVSSGLTPPGKQQGQLTIIERQAKRQRVE
ncbi:hypothetical protein GGR55DRAFT_600165 [Xylaria sp. FL0064]|nr:hypothetical protein GGR55DRAFT_600165 [Xylaria sp. FL0064]